MSRGTSNSRLACRSEDEVVTAEGSSREQWWVVEALGLVPWVSCVSCDVWPSIEAVGSPLEHTCARACTSLLLPGLHPDFLALLEILRTA